MSLFYFLLLLLKCLGVRLLDDGTGLLGLDFDMAGGRLVGPNATMGTVRPATLVHRTVNRDMRDDQVGSGKALEVGIGLQILEELKQRVDALDRPAATEGLKLFGLGGAAGVGRVSEEGHAAPAREDVPEVTTGLADRHAAENIGGVQSVLVVTAEVTGLGLHGLLGVGDLTGIVEHHFLSFFFSVGFWL